MAANDALNHSDSWRPSSSDSRWLADALRSCRLSVLCGSTGSGKTALLTTGLLPLLRRRAEDTQVSTARVASQAIMPFPERRSAARARLAELVVFVDRWGPSPLSALHERIDQALREAGVEPEITRPALLDRVRALGDRHGTRLLFILDDFDTLLNARDPGAEHDELLGALVQLLNRRMPANAVIAMRSLTESTFLAFGDRLFSVEAEVLMLTPAHTPVLETVTPHLQAVPSRAVESTAPMITVLSPSPPRAPPPADATPDAPAPEIVVRPATAEPRRGRAWWWAAAGLAMLAFVLRMVLDDSPAAPPAQAQAIASIAALPTPTPPARPQLTAAPAQPRVDLLVPSDGEVPRLPTQLAAALAADSGVDLRVKVAGSEAASWRAAAGSPHLAVLRYDALQRAAALKTRPVLSVVAPLYTEEIAFVVRADSPLRFIHQLRGRRIDAGSADSSRSLTAKAVYQSLFGEAMPKAPDTQPDASAALRALANGPAPGRSPDAVMLVAPAPESAWATLPAETRSQLRLLRLEADDPASRRALRTYLPATLRADGAAAAGTPTLASVAFLVVAGSASAEQDEVLRRLAQALCSGLPGLQHSGSAKWREVRAGQQLDSGWPSGGTAAAAWSRCAAPEAPVRASTPPLSKPLTGATS